MTIQTKGGYKFDESQPPLMKNVGRDVRAVPTSDLMTEMGTATWKTHNFVPHFVSSDDMSPSGGFRPRPTHSVVDTTFVLTRTLRWAIAGDIIHFAEPETLKVTTTIGYELTKQRTMEEALEVGAEGGEGLGGFKLNVDVKKSLKITDTTTEQWTQQTTTETDQQFQGGVTYVTWSLIDSLQLNKTVVEQFYADDPTEAWGPPKTTTSSNSIDCVISIWQDKLAD